MAIITIGSSLIARMDLKIEKRPREGDSDPFVPTYLTHPIPSLAINIGLLFAAAALYAPVLVTLRRCTLRSCSKTLEAASAAITR